MTIKKQKWHQKEIKGVLRIYKPAGGELSAFDSLRMGDKRNGSNSIKYSTMERQVHGIPLDVIQFIWFYSISIAQRRFCRSECLRWHSIEISSQGECVLRFPRWFRKAFKANEVFAHKFSTPRSTGVWLMCYISGKKKNWHKRLKIIFDGTAR